MNYDRTGYPRIGGRDAQSLYGRIVAVVDCFDAMTAHRAYRRSPLTPHGALHEMITRCHGQFDPLILKVFVNTVGIYPAGTVVLLDTNEIAVVTTPHADDVFRPRARIVADRDRKPVRGEEIELSQQDATTGAYRASIVSALDPVEYGINLAEALA